MELDGLHETKLPTSVLGIRRGDDRRYASNTAKVTERLWEIGDIMNVLEAWGAAN